MGGFTPYKKCKLLCIRLLQFHTHPDTVYRVISETLTLLQPCVKCKMAVTQVLTKNQVPQKRYLTFCVLSGAGKNRTADTRIFSPLLYHLSYSTVGNAKVVFFLNFANLFPIKTKNYSKEYTFSLTRVPSA